MSKASIHTKPEDRVSIGQKLAVGAGGVPWHHGGMIVQYMAQPIYQIVLGLNPVLFGLAMTIPRIWDAFTDPVMGRISDRHHSRWGRRRPFIFSGALAMALSFMLIWMVPRGLSEWATFSWLVVSSILFFTAFTVFSVPLTSLTYELTPDYHERTRVMAFWGFFVTAGNLFINWYPSAAAWEGFGDVLAGARWVALGLGVVVFFGLGSLPAIFGRERFYTVAVKEEQAVGFMTAIRQAVSSRPMLALIGLILGLNFCGTIGASLAQYIVIYHVKGGDFASGIALNAMNGTGFAIVGFAAIPLLSWLSARIGKRSTMFVVLGLAFFGGIAKWFIFTPERPYLLLLDSVLNGPVWVALGVILPSMMADLCDWDEHQHGERREGVISAAFTWVTKVGLSFTFLFSGIALQVSGFDESLGAAQPEGTMTMMRLFFAGSSVLAPLVAILCMLVFPITEKKANEIRSELETRRGTV
jgi:glycoside/pentoside/hexuronide:cation symporter, GPH family